MNALMNKGKSFKQAHKALKITHRWRRRRIIFSINRTRDR